LHGVACQHWFSPRERRLQLHEARRADRNPKRNGPKRSWQAERVQHGADGVPEVYVFIVRDVVSLADRRPRVESKYQRLDHIFDIGEVNQIVAVANPTQPSTSGGVD